ncbi:hypothetical protein MTHERMOG20_17970 [Moorella thermoacetica]|nr:hypothetical protein MOTHE_c04700 [Moorella thermoacetica]AKX95920.1 hypothetical protein MOTHA_c05600 [Moorella thermoacetica]OIQ56005.1 hypothetical protein MOCA_17050 [Moorella thermoacetica]QCZ99731.1 hypothetical protein MothHH_00573 [Moorella thermoacetica]TYL08188.1 hypothetical protein MOLA_19130 [Moorella thermoacetica]
MIDEQAGIGRAAREFFVAIATAVGDIRQENGRQCGIESL